MSMHLRFWERCQNISYSLSPADIAFKRKKEEVILQENEAEQ